MRFSAVDFTYPPGGLRLTGHDAVLADFTWEVPQGLTVLLGPNGAGKSTLLALGATALHPTRGSVSHANLDSRNRADIRPLRQAIGWMPQQIRPIPGFTAREQVAYAGWLKGLGRAAAWAKAIWALEATGLADQANRLAAQLSGGQLRRVGLAQTLAHDAEVLLLDEPTAGLDPAQRAGFREVVKEIGASRQVLISTHQVDDLDELFETVIILDHGRVKFEGSVKGFLGLVSADGPRRAERAYAALVREN